MANTSFSLWLFLVFAVILPGCCQHWSFGLSPGGKRELDDLSNTLDNIIERFPHADALYSVLGCKEKSPLDKTCREGGLFGSATKREKRERKYKK
ncbi:progonadoliberin-1-like [Cheilinus undulatus]|uniref:progonadoliberin-1-like n=1 Tax=Cheilinus undulatus TaxID=241271 RepID=UPI001BD56B09|nr:progonadoliberin-1-like [Cheilinus undulatus]